MIFGVTGSFRTCVLISSKPSYQWIYTDTRKLTLYLKEGCVVSPEKYVTSPTSVKLQKQPSFALPKPEIAIAKVPEHQARSSLIFIFLEWVYKGSTVMKEMRHKPWSLME